MPAPEPLTVADQIQTAISRGEAVALPDGVVGLTAPMKFDHTAGAGFRGASPGNPWGGGWAAKPTVLKWIGPTNGGPVISIHAATATELSNIVVDGNHAGVIGIRLTSEPGWGTGGLTTDRVTIRNCAVAIQCGAKVTDGNCDATDHRCLNLLACDVGLQTLNHQSVNHHFTHLVARKVGTVFDLKFGGNVAVDVADVGEFDLWLRDGYGGPNAMTRRFAACRFEMNGYRARHARLVDSSPTDCTDIVFDGCQETEGPQNMRLIDNSDPVMLIGSGAAVTLRNHVHGQRPYARMYGGSYHDQNGRWVYYVPTDVSRGSGLVKIVDPLDAKGRKLEGI